MILSTLLLGLLSACLVWGIGCAVAKGRRARAHAKNSPTCWCAPELLQYCPETPEGPDVCSPSCWRCGGRGLVEPWSGSRPTIIIHRQ